MSKQPAKRFRLRELGIALVFALTGSMALAFCGFYVAKIDGKLFNKSSEVIIAREGNRTILTMANDYQGDVKEFALVVPIPYVFKEEQIQVGDPTIFERIDAYSAPRLVEYFDEDPCAPMFESDVMPMSAASPEQSSADIELRAKSLGVTIEEQFSVGEYDILILGAEESSGLETWLNENGYKLPDGASEALAPYIKMGMNFFVAKVNLERFEAKGYASLRPIMMAFESDAFMLPIQLGMLNADGPQDLTVYLLSPQGRVELENYRVATIPSDVYVPEFVENEFADMYRAMFDTAYAREGEKVVFLEYAWDMAWCDPCAADPLSPDELQRAGVFWLDNNGLNNNGLNNNGDFQAPNVYLSRLHVRYTKAKFPEDLMFRVTENRENFQGRYILQRPFKGKLTCGTGRDYVSSVRERQDQEAQTLARLTGWDYADIKAKIPEFNPDVSVPNWWERVFDVIR
jgi:hypothetical protein